MGRSIRLYKHNQFFKFVTVVIALSPMFLQYSLFVPVLLFPEFFLILALLAATVRRTNVDLPLLFLVVVLVFYLLVLSFIKYNAESYMLLTLSLTTSFRLFFYFVILAVLSKSYFVRDFAAKILVFVAASNSLYGLIQFFTYNFFKISLPWSLPFLTVQHGQRLITEQDFIFDKFGFRFSGLFSEPAHFSQYIGFAFFVVLFYDGGRFFNKNSKVFLSVLFTLSLLLSASGTGFFVIIFIVALLLYKILFESVSFIKFFISISVFVFFISALVLLLFSNDIFYLGVQRVLDFSDTSSLYVRMIRPLVVFSSLDYIDMIFGIGYGNYSSYVFYQGIENAYEAELGFAWTNSLGVFLVGSGMIGFAIVIFIYGYLLRKADNFGRVALLFVLVHFLFSDLPHSIFFVCFASFLYGQNLNRFRVLNKGLVK
ncbi:hypothetical protein LEO80_14170 [Aeromonas caviae]|uniref:hypothetical protein n=1 Tax=Aeromonas caviae TaxID=648 RepID=UPI001D0B9867|nr:hypothetical protein [Aeromonas caviae]UDN25713.1 hypothetical protein LEO80_14170 [Aeromonas caviae]